MIYRRFGRTELAMPVITCGGMRYQQSWQDVELAEVEAANQANLEACIRAALAAGINHIETARGYGSSERQLGQVLPLLPRDEMIVQTKVGPAETGQGYLDGFNTSMSRLRLDHVDLLALHGINNRDVLEMAIKPGGSLDMAEELKRQGRCRHIGFSTHGPTDVIVDAIETGRFDYVNLHWYWSDQANWPAIEAATRHDMGVFIISPNDKGGQLYKPSDKLTELCSPLAPMVFNDLFCLRDERVHTISIGAARPSDFAPAIEAANLLPRAEELLPPILARLDQAGAQALGDDWMAGWHKGLPGTDEVPGTINLYQVLRLYTLAKAYDMVEFARARHGLFGHGGHWFYGNQVDKLDLDALLPLLADCPVADRIPAALAEARELLVGEQHKRLSEGG